MEGVSWIVHFRVQLLTVIRIHLFFCLDVELTGEQVEIKPHFTDGSGDDGANGGTCGGRGGGGDDNDGDKSDIVSDDANAKRNKALLMSQKFTLGFAALVGVGGLMGYLKSGSHKSLASGGLSALHLYYVYTELPKRPVFTSSVGLRLSAALLLVMGSWFKRSGKVFPAGIVSLVSIIMTSGYMHGIMKVH
ncbi:protein FATTY ACID EXPORT 7-like [Silene latifolia]|uniref:protein FATTY ACID EXPORT 7-like n=1 Tax=Silene latifolia TaxID=37657 RepID=UPI003D77792C